MRTYTDQELESAITGSHSWRAVLRHLGLASTSAGAMRSVRRRADQLELDYSHFRGQRRWSDADLAQAVERSTSWAQVVETLGLTGGSSVATVRGHAARLHIDATHLRPAAPVPRNARAAPQPALTNLPRAGTHLAAAWFALCGAEVSWPLEPCRYDLLVWRDHAAQRVQVKTTTLRVNRSWKVRLATSGAQLVTYDPDEIDQFFIVDGDLRLYLIPVDVVGGLKAIHLAKYEQFAVTWPAGQLGATAPATPC